jgi:GNAT superfamily N-acetyltransferase
MARFVVFAADSTEIIARTSAQAGIGLATQSDRDPLVALGLSATWLDRTLVDDSWMIVVAKLYGRILGYYACSVRTEIEQAHWLIIRSMTGNDILARYAFVIPEYRGRGILGLMKGCVTRQLEPHGYRRLISLVATRNRASLQAQAHVGAVPLSTVFRVRMGKLILAWEARNIRQARFVQAKPLVVTI